MKKPITLTTSAKTALFGVFLGATVLLGGIPFQIILGLGRIGTTGEAEKLVYQMMSQGSLVLIAGYILLFLSGICFWLLGPFSLKHDRWFLLANLAFYGWLPLDWYFINLDLRFAQNFNPVLPLTHELKHLFDMREAFAPLPLLMLIGYLVAIGLSIYQPRFRRKENQDG